MLDFLPGKLYESLKRMNLDRISEIRLRVDKPAFCCIDGVYREFYEPEFILSENEMAEIILKLTKHSLYAYVEQIREGYLCGNKGERIGLCGFCVYDGDIIKIIKNFSSLCIRIPHQVFDSSKKIYELCESSIKNIVIIGPPGSGKTTILRDLTYNLSKMHRKNILVIDEKMEISGSKSFDLGETTDVLVSNKSFGFTSGVANLRPDLIITDEIIKLEDLKYATQAILSGVKVITSVHGNSVSDLKRKPIYSNLLENGLFDYAVSISLRSGFGTVEEIVSL